MVQNPVLPGAKVVAMYCYPVFGGKHDILAQRFVNSYVQHKAGYEHELWVVSNGGPPTPTMKGVFAKVTTPVHWMEHDDTGLDIGAYRKAAATLPADLMVFFGGSAYLRGSPWLARMVQVWQRHGRALYGSTANQGNPGCGCYQHIRTTGFWMPPELLNSYPHPVTSEQSSRYAFEHGSASLTMWVNAQGLKCWMVTWEQEELWPHWDSLKNGYHNGDQSGLIVGDRLTEPEYYKVRGRIR